jgi:hypothetical protein
MKTLDIASLEWDTTEIHSDKKEGFPKNRTSYSLTILNNEIIIYGGISDNG